MTSIVVWRSTVKVTSITLQMSTWVGKLKGRLFNEIQEAALDEVNHDWEHTESVTECLVNTAQVNVRDSFVLVLVSMFRFIFLNPRVSSKHLRWMKLLVSTYHFICLDLNNPVAYILFHLKLRNTAAYSVSEDVAGDHQADCPRVGQSQSLLTPRSSEPPSVASGAVSSESGGECKQVIIGSKRQQKDPLHPCQCHFPYPITAWLAIHFWHIQPVHYTVKINMSF